MSLAPVLLEHAGALYADMQQYYGLDADALLRAGEFHRLRALAEQLPPGSRTVAAIDPRAGWATSDWLLALVADQLAYMRYEQAGGKGKKPKQVKRPPAPKKKAQKKLNVSKREVRSLLFAPRKKVGD